MQEPPELEAPPDPVKVMAVKTENEDSDTDIEKPKAIEDKKEPQSAEAKEASQPANTAGVLGKLKMFWHEVKEGAKEICSER